MSLVNHFERGPGSIGISFFASTGGTHIGVFGHRPASSSKNFTSDCAYLNPRIILLLSRRVSVIENRILQRISYMFASGRTSISWDKKAQEQYLPYKTKHNKAHRQQHQSNKIKK
uniref:Uncharacterized protein n=1 Tax=Opuntia streptacantha TaxID=393608 RepID=A0A7C9CI63_OPUST